MSGSYFFLTFLNYYGYQAVNGAGYSVRMDKKISNYLNMNFRHELAMHFSERNPWTEKKYFDKVAFLPFMDVLAFAGLIDGRLLVSNICQRTNLSTLP